MSEIILETREGIFVARLEVIPFQVFPGVMIWGDRFFVHSRHNVFREELVYVIPPVLEAA